MKKTKQELLKDFEDWGVELLKTLDDQVENKLKLALAHLLAAQLSGLKKLDGRNKKTLLSYYNFSKDLFSKAYQDVVEEDEDKHVCSECGDLMEEGYWVYEGLEHYCSDECLLKNYTEEEFNEMYENDDAYWTEWD